MGDRRADRRADRPVPRPVVVVGGGGERSAGDVLASGSDRTPGRWRGIPPLLGIGVVLLAVLAAGLVMLVSGAAEPEAVPPPPLGALGPAGARVDDGRLLVRVEAELRTREPVVLRDGVVTGGAFVVLVDPVASPEPGAPDAVRSRVVALVDPRCAAGPLDVPLDPVLEIVVSPQAGGESATLTSGIPLRSFRGAARSACAPVRVSAGLPPDGGGQTPSIEVTVRLVDAAVPVQVLRLSGRGLEVDPRAVAAQVAAADGRAPAVTVTAPVVVTDCAVDVLAPRRLVLEVQRGDDRLRVPVQTSAELVAALDELVRRTCRRARG